jgi:hypothetical protein
MGSRFRGNDDRVGRRLQCERRSAENLISAPSREARRSLAAAAEPGTGWPVVGPMFFLFSNKLGCLGSLAISAGITLLLLVLLGWVQF